MGTRSLTFVYDGDKPIMNMYRQYDGYPEGHGQELSDFLISGKMVVGYSDTKTIQFNGMGCLAAQLIAYFKHTVGGFYIHAITDTDCGQEYEYHVFEDKVVVQNPGEVIFSGTWQDFKDFCCSKAKSCKSLLTRPPLSKSIIFYRMRAVLTNQIRTHRLMWWTRVLTTFSWA
jgi:hypothetical protein